MSSTFGEKIKVTIFGESHAEEIGVKILGLPKGIQIDKDKLQAFLNRRRPGFNEFSTPRKEADLCIFTKGIEENEQTSVTNGDEVVGIIKNTNRKSSDYDELKNIPRPGHADFAARMKYGDDFDFRGGGQFSGRMTAPLCIAGGIFKQLLEEKGIHISAHVAGIGGIMDDAFNPLCNDVYEYGIFGKDFPVINDEAGEKMKKKILEAKENEDSVGGIIECMITGLPAGIGEPMFDGIENEIAKACFGIPAVKGIEFGNGFECSNLFGSENNDQFEVDDSKIKTITNNQGGILGGITTSMPVYFRVAMKPTPSIAKTQRSVDLKTMENVELNIKGRHDPCIVQRAVPCVEAAAAMALFELM